MQDKVLWVEEMEEQEQDEVALQRQAQSKGFLPDLVSAAAPPTAPW